MDCLLPCWVIKLVLDISIRELDVTMKHILISIKNKNKLL